MRIVAPAMLTFLVCSCTPEATFDGQTTEAVADDVDKTGDRATVTLSYYKRKALVDGQVPAPPVLLRLSGTLQEKNGCLVVSNKAGDHALVFEEGAATFDPELRVLSSGSTEIAIGNPISVGGPFNQPDDSFDPSAVADRCGVENVWLVTASDVKSQP